MADLPAADESFAPAALERGRLLFAGPCDFFAGAMTVGQLPPARGPEIAFAGRSNVGKSSLVNALCGRKALARTSNTPGRTQQLNFFELDGRFVLVDMPGYGYNAAGKARAAAWTRLIERYLAGRQTLTRVLLLIDARHGVKPIDQAWMKRLDKAAQSYQIVLTKMDKVEADERAATLARVEAAAERHPAAYPVLLATSSETGEGIAELRATLAELAAP